MLISLAETYHDHRMVPGYLGESAVRGNHLTYLLVPIIITYYASINHGHASLTLAAETLDTSFKVKFF